MVLFFVIVMILSWLSTSSVGEPYIEVQEFNPYDNDAQKKYVLDHAWEFKCVEDCFEFRDLRQTGWKGNAEDFYRWKEEE